MMVAVKKLRNEQLEVLSQNFDSEADCLKKVKHKNIVRFLGHCSNTQMVPMLYEGKEVLGVEREKLLCFEYLSKGTLDKYFKGRISHILLHSYLSFLCSISLMSIFIFSILNGSLDILPMQSVHIVKKQVSLLFFY